MRAILALVLALALAPAAHAGAWPEALTGRLAAIGATGTVRVGYRTDVIPFSFTVGSGPPRGYSIDLCEAIVSALAADLGRPLGVAYVPVTAADRLAQVRSGAVDLECGATTATSERMRQVAFSPTIFVSTTRIAVPSESAVRDVATLRGQRVAVVRGTTAEAALGAVDRLRGLRLEIVAVDGYREAFDLVRNAGAAALAADDVLIAGAAALDARVPRFRLVGDALSVERYAIVLPRDDSEFAAAVARALQSLAVSREILWIYDRWFVGQLPNGRRMDLPMSVQLRRSLELIGLPPD